MIAGDALRRAGAALGGPTWARRLDRAVVGTTDLGSLYGVAGIAAVLAATGRRRTAADVLGVGAVAWNLAQASKTRVRRQRPYEASGVRRLIRPPTGSSFPSGHATVGTAVMAVLAEQARSPAARRAFDATGAYVALSRVYAGVHYPTDVAGGAGLGLLLGALWRGPAAAVGRGAVGVLARTTARALELTLWLRGRRSTRAAPQAAVGREGPTPGRATGPPR